MYESIPASLPQEFFYNLSKLQGSLSKNLLKVTADRTTASPGNITNFRLPIGSLIDLRSLSVWWKTAQTALAYTRSGPGLLTCDREQIRVK